MDYTIHQAKPKSYEWREGKPSRPWTSPNCPHETREGATRAAIDDAIEKGANPSEIRLHGHPDREVVAELGCKEVKKDSLGLRKRKNLRSALNQVAARKRDVASAAHMCGLDIDEFRQMLDEHRARSGPIEAAPEKEKPNSSAPRGGGWPKDKPRRTPSPSISDALAKSHETLTKLKEICEPNCISASARELARRCGVEPKSVRRWLEADCLPAPQHDAGIKQWAEDLRKEAARIKDAHRELSRNGWAELPWGDNKWFREISDKYAAKTSGTIRGIAAKLPDHIGRALNMYRARGVAKDPRIRVAIARMFLAN